MSPFTLLDHQFLLCNKRVLVLFVSKHPLLQEAQFRKKNNISMGHIILNENFIELYGIGVVGG